MDVPHEEFSGSNDHTLIVKEEVEGGGYEGGGGGDVYSSFPSPTTSSEISTSTEEDEDMANCLILLAQGVGSRQVEEEGKIEKFSTQTFTDLVTIKTGTAGFYVYECKTCNRTFPSFQALGGHRASHKKSKLAMVEEKKVPMTHIGDDIEGGQFNKIISPPLSLQTPSTKASHHGMNKPKIHECSICGSEFSSGQALGGHMRRHRTPRITMSIDTSSTIEYHEDDKPRNILSLDLNLPAPEDDLRDSKFQFTPNQQHLVFSAPALVDCHY
ncbi:hypothetical protein F0562_001989 [Nyssa sinensis]|uniref:C2H2-type domain-containing protein n=1 Tax=Nyssa sinensis TaxID=561372 RepID=A0A5J5C4P5_9ASTE|nr:hypothetical protein F0562_001989 [Nyssa sinensis]